MAQVISELIEEWVIEREAIEFVWTDREGNVHTKPAGEPYPALRAGGLPTGRPVEQ